MKKSTLAIAIPLLSAVLSLTASSAWGLPPDEFSCPSGDLLHCEMPVPGSGEDPTMPKETPADRALDRRLGKLFKQCVEREQRVNHRSSQEAAEVCEQSAP
jgi:hypothetical protein